MLAIVIPLTIPAEDDLTGKEIYSYSFKLNFLEAVLDAPDNGYSTTGTISDGCFIAYNNLNDGYIVVSVASFALPLSGYGVLIDLLFDIVGDIDETTDLTFSEFSLNEGGAGEGVDTHDGEVTIVEPRHDIEGNATYFVGYDEGGGALAGLNISMTGDTTTVVTTDSVGHYLFANILDGNYTIAPVNDDYLDRPLQISSYDASLALQADAELITLTANQQIAADASGDGSVTSFDASLIGRYVAEYIDEFPAGPWYFVPDSITFAPFEEDMSDQDFLAIGIGDVSGNGNSSALLRDDANVVITIPITQLPPNSIVEIPLMIEYENIEIFSYHFVASFSDLIFVDAQTEGTLSDGWAVISNAEDEGVHLVSYNTEVLEGEGLLINLICETGDIGTANLSLNNILMNESAVESSEFEFIITPGVAIPSGATPAMPTNYSLTQNYPNPFNPTTMITFTIPQTSQVSLAVYDITGKLIKSLIAKPMDAGYHSVIWNGTDENGKGVASGVYFYKLKAGDFSQTRKCLLLK